ncbi:hypothetical protein BLOT_002865 [Blomia tropicalis]|nr:hypothetical protein BLOT_002865 [Blomia tropicalis]
MEAIVMAFGGQQQQQQKVSQANNPIDSTLECDRSHRHRTKQISASRKQIGQWLLCSAMKDSHSRQNEKTIEGGNGGITKQQSYQLNGPFLNISLSREQPMDPKIRADGDRLVARLWPPSSSSEQQARAIHFDSAIQPIKTRDELTKNNGLTRLRQVDCVKDCHKTNEHTNNGGGGGCSID